MIRTTYTFALSLSCLLSGLSCTEDSGPPFDFTAVQPDLFGSSGAQPNAWADYDNDGDLDLFIGFRGAPDRLYRNDNGNFTDVGALVGLADTTETRAAAWGDFDGDGHLDLYVGFALTEMPNKLYRNEGNGAHFTNVAAEMGLAEIGVTRQPTWIDYDQDSDLDLFVAFRERANKLYRNDGNGFSDVTESSGIGDPRRTVGVAWFDMDMDGDFDVFVANQNGDQDGFFRNNGDGTFTDVASEMGMDWPDRGDEYGSVGTAVTDYDNDGDLDLFIATYGPDVLWQNQGDGTFLNVAQGTMAEDHHSTTAAWADADNDGRPDLYVAAFLSSEPEEPDHIFHNMSSGFTSATPPPVAEFGASHGVSWADYDQDGDLDLALANNNAIGKHLLYRNDKNAGHSLQVTVTTKNHGGTIPGAEVRLFSPDGDPLGARLVGTGGGYCSQGAKPVHFGLGDYEGNVRIEITTFKDGERVTNQFEATITDEPLHFTLEVS
jgi:hypothetical protein